MLLRQVGPGRRGAPRTSVAPVDPPLQLHLGIRCTWGEPPRGVGAGGTPPVGWWGGQTCGRCSYAVPMPLPPRDAAGSCWLEMPWPGQVTGTAQAASAGVLGRQRRAGGRANLSNGSILIMIDSSTDRFIQRSRCSSQRCRGAAAAGVTPAGNHLGFRLTWCGPVVEPCFSHLARRQE